MSNIQALVDALEKIKTISNSINFGDRSHSWYKEQINTISIQALADYHKSQKEYFNDIANGRDDYEPSGSNSDVKSLASHSCTSCNTIGQLITEAIKLRELNPDVVEKELDFPKGILRKVMADRFYTNSVPVVLFKNLIISLHIPFDKIEAAMRPTFELLLSKETPESIKKKPKGYMLWENQESVNKYTNHLRELINQGDVVGSQTNSIDKK